MKAIIARLLRMLEDFPLRPTIAAALILGLCLPVGVSVWRDLADRRETLLNQLAADHAMLAEVLAISMQTPIWEVRPDSGRPLIEAIMRDERVTSILVVSPLIPQFLAASTSNHRNDDVLHREHPVIRNGEIIGTVSIDMTTEPLEREISAQWARVLMTGLLQMGLGLLLIFPLLRLKVLSPLGRLLDQSRALAAGDLETPFEWRRADELGGLGRRFEATRQSLASLFANLGERNVELQKHQAELAEQTAVLRAILDNMTDGITLVDHDLRIIAWNQRFIEMFDLPAALVWPGVAMTDIHRFDLTRGRWKAANADSYLKTLASSYMPDRQTAMDVEMAGGQVIHMCRRPVPKVGYVSTYSDITAQVEAARRAGEALKLLEAVMDAVPAVLHVKDRELRYRMVNRRFLEISGLTRDEIIGKTIHEAFAPERMEGHDDPDRELLGAGKPLPFHERKITLYGAEPWDALSTKVPLRDERGKVSHIVTVELDISERKRAETALRESEELYRLLVDISPYGILLHDSTGIVFLNRAGCRILEVADAGDVIGRHYLEFVVPTERDEAAHRVMQVQEEGGELPSAERRLVTAKGREIDVAIVAVPFVRGGARLALVMFRDITESKRMERALRESERHFRSLVESHPLPVWVVDFASGDILYESPASAELFGRAAPSKGSTNVVAHWPDPEERQEFLAQLAAGNELRDYEWQARREDGSLIWVMVRARLIRQDDRDLIVSSMFDLTERKLREAEMREARETLEDAIESLSEGFALFDPLDRLVICNTRYREFHSKSRDLIVAGVTWADFIRAAAERGEFELGGKTVDAWVQSMLAQRRAGIRNLEIQHVDGCWYQISHQRTRRGGTAVIRTEITHLKTMEQALRESEERFRSIANAHPVPVIICTINEGEVLYASPAAAGLWGGPGGDLIGRRVTEFYAEPRDRETFLAAFKRDGHLDSFPLRLKRADGREFPAAVAARPIVYDSRPAIVSGIFDLTEQKAAEAEIAKQREALHQSEKLNALGSLLAGVAHELNNPLSVVVGRSIMLESADVDPRIAASVTKIRLAAERCARIVKTFLAMARQQAPSRVPVRLADVVDASLELVAYRLRSAGIEIIRDIAADMPETMADPDQLNQVFSNLFLNAQQAMAETAAGRAKLLRIDGRFDRKANMLEIEISDTGPGIPADVMPRVFEPFFTTKPAGVGTGIGLAVTRGIIQSHGGSIAVHTPANGEGAVFCIRLPVQPVDPASNREATVKLETPSARRILIVDDEPDIARMLAEILSADGHSVAVAEDGRQALQALAGSAFDLVISDLIMPDLDGVGLYKRLQEVHPDLAERVIFMTGDTLSRRAKALVAKTMRPMIEKPFTPEEARRTVQNVLDRLAG